MERPNAGLIVATERRRGLAVSLATIGAVLCVFGANLIVIDRYGSDLPYADQWGKEAAFVLAPLFEGDPTWRAAALLPHNEHRIYFTIAVNTGLAVLSGQWDARQQCVLSALLHALVTAWLAVFGWKRLGGKWGIFVALLCVCLASLPLVWNNTVWGFQSQYHFLIGFSLLAIDGLLRSRFSARWWIGVAASVAAIFSMGSGFVAAAALLMVLTRDAFPKREEWRRLLPSVAVVVGVLSLGLYLHTAVPWHAQLRATNASEFLAYAARCLAWPRLSQPFWALLLYSPLAVLCIRWLWRGAGPDERGHTLRFTIALGLWVLIQIAAVSYSRGGEGGVPANRYGEVFAIGVIVNAMALAQLAPSRQRAKWMLWAGCWFAVLAVGATSELRGIFCEELPRHAQEMRAFETTVRDYVRTGDAAALEGRPIPFPDRAWFLQIIDRPSVRSLLPPSVSHPPRTSTLSAFAQQLSRAGWFVMSIGLAGLALAVWLRYPSRTPPVPSP